MKKSILLLLAVAAACITSCKKSDDSPATVSCKPTLETDFNAAGRKTGTTKFTWDGSGMLNKSEDADSTGKVTYTKNYTYDGSGNLTKQESVDYSYITPKTTTYTWSNYSGSHPGTQTYSYDGSTSTSTYTYTWNGDNLIKQTGSNSNFNNSSSVYLYTYDGNGNKTTEVRKSIDNGVTTTVDTTVYGSYSHGRPGTVAYYSKQTGTFALSGTAYFTYDGNGNCTQKEYLSAEPGSTRFTYYTAIFSNVKFFNPNPYPISYNDRDTYLTSSKTDYENTTCTYPYTTLATPRKTYSNTSDIQANSSGCITSYSSSYTEYNCDGTVNMTGSSKSTLTY